MCVGMHVRVHMYIHTYIRMCGCFIRSLEMPKETMLPPTLAEQPIMYHTIASVYIPSEHCCIYQH